MRKLGLSTIILLLVVLAGCGIEGKLNQDGGYTLSEDRRLTVLTFDVKKGAGKATITTHSIPLWSDETSLNEKIEVYDVTIDKEVITISGLIPIQMRIEGKELTLKNPLGGSDEKYKKSSKKDIEKLLKALNEEIDAEQE